MAALSCKAAVALIALSSLLVISYAAGDQPGNFSASDFTADPNWEAARATWYGAPTGAGPMDDGIYTVTRLYVYGVAIPSAIVRVITVYLCRWCVWVQERGPVPFLLHDVLRQRAHFQGRQGLRLLLPGA